MASTNPQNGLTELESFLPQDNSIENGVKKYKITKANDLETANLNVDPFKSRNSKNSVSDAATLTHLLKASLGSGILSMPAAFFGSGLVLGIFASIAISIICTHCAYILVTSAHELYRKTGKPQMTFPEVAEEACLNGPPWAHKFASSARKIILAGLFVTYFMIASCYSVIMSENFNYVINYHLGYTIEIRITIAIMMVPLILLAYVPNLKYLVPFSMVANIFMAIGLGITLYYLAIDVPSISERNLITQDITTFPVFISITIFALEAIGVIMPLENNMKTPQHFTGLCGVLNQGMGGVTLAYIIVGFFGYLKYGPEVQGAITLNLPIEDYAAQTVNILIGAAVFCTFGLQFYVCLEIGWNAVKDRYTNNPTMAQYILRTVMVVSCVSIAIAVPRIVPFVSLIGAFCFSLLGLVAPILIEIVTFWDKGFGKFYWKIVKNVIVILTAVLALIFGSKGAIEDIVKIYTTDNIAVNSTGT
ncbi:proton-coupled amino acid transporter-like protein pathetic [Leptinotarsa decemlineata]|uniref:proton-coupled amino acid transporter-like protein pathetic n=1 Tax=Leptinotarsa decemlineata TaxID=7539 RepID=UPI000C2547F9|nr:proton-coupled amino acid transporter-like protein pathetic [Leptinotarsa decemlineata]